MISGGVDMMQPGARDKVGGTTEVSEDVICDMVGYAAMGSYGIVGMASPSVADGIARLLPVHKLRRGIVLDSDEGGVTVDLHVILEYGTNLTVVSENLANSVRYVLTEYAQLPVKDVAIHIEGIKVR
jgi:uncharacterized alkaline shock family protein YloU